EDVPQPDVYLRILPASGGQSRDRGKYPEGAPEMVAEVCVSSRAYDLHQKRELYRAAGVREYLAVLVEEQAIRWHRRGRTGFRVVPAGADGVHRSAVFPGLWLDGPALLKGDMARVLATLGEGLAAPEHA